MSFVCSALRFFKSHTYLISGISGAVTFIASLWRIWKSKKTQRGKKRDFRLKFHVDYSARDKRSTGFPNLASFILIPICASTPNIRGKSRMQQFCTCGSVRGASGQLASLPRPLGCGVTPLDGTNYWGKLGSPKFRTIAHAYYLEPRFLGSFRVDHPGVDRFDQHTRVSRY